MENIIQQACPCFGTVTQRGLSPTGERGRCVTGQNNAEKETKVRMEQMQLRDNEQMCAFISDKLEVFLSNSPLSPSLSCMKTGFLPSKHVSCFTNNSTGGKNSNKFMGEHSLTAWRLGLLRTKDFHNKFVLNTRFKLWSWFVKIHQILIKYWPILDQVLHSLWPGTTLVETKETFTTQFYPSPNYKGLGNAMNYLKD